MRCLSEGLKGSVPVSERGIYGGRLMERGGEKGWQREQVKSRGNRK